MIIRELFTKNLLLKILAIIGAVFLWTYVINEGYRVDFIDTEIPIEAYNVSEDLALANDLGSVKLKVRVPTSISNSSLLEDTKAFVDLKGLRPGIYEKEIKVTFENPAITLIELQPEKIKVELDNLASIDKEIQVETSGEINENYQIDDALVSLPTAQIKGASASLEKVVTLVAPVSISGEMSEIKKIVELEARDQNNEKITEVSIHPKTVEVTIPVQTKEEIKTVGIKANLSGNPAPGYFVTQTSINPNSISIKGNTDLLNTIFYLNTQPIDISGISTNSEKVTQLDIPEGIELLDQNELTVNIQLDAQLATRTIDSVIKFNNIGGDLEINSYDPDYISVIVEGGAPIINNLTSGGVVTNIDLGGKGAGSFTIAINPSMITLPDSVSLKNIQTSELKITLKKK